MRDRHPATDPFRGFEVRADGSKPPVILIYDQIGRDRWSETGIGATEILKVLDEMKDEPEIEVRVNSPGGLAFDGVAIYNALVRFPGRVVTHVDGHALSAASIVVMAGDEICMADNAMMMIHSPSIITCGNADDHRARADILDRLEGQLITVYAARTGIDRAELSEMLRAETWMDAAEAQKKGFVDTITESKGPAASFDLSAFNYRRPPAEALGEKQPMAVGAPEEGLELPPVTRNFEGSADEIDQDEVTPADPSSPGEKAAEAQATFERAQQRVRVLEMELHADSLM